MPVPPSVAPFVAQIADLATDLRRGVCCLVVCDKGWTLPIVASLKERLKAMNVRFACLDGRATEKEHVSLGPMTVTTAKMRYVVGTPEMDDVVVALPYLDIMTAAAAGWNALSRETVPLLYENASTIWLGFQDPTLPLLPIVEKVFTRRYVIAEPYRTLETVPPPPPPPPLEPAPPIEVAREPEPPSEEAPHTDDAPPPDPDAPPD